MQTASVGSTQTTPTEPTNAEVSIMMECSVISSDMMVVLITLTRQPWFHLLPGGDVRTDQRKCMQMANQLLQFTVESCTLKVGGGLYWSTHQRVTTELSYHFL